MALAFGAAMLTPAILNGTAFLILYSLTLLLIGARSRYLQRS